MEQQPYDGSIKAIMQEDAETIVPLLLPGATLIEVLDIEILRAPMRVDRVYRIRYQGILHILHLEFQASADDTIASRLLIYNATLWREHKHKLPVISIIVYLFKRSVPVAPLKMMSGDREILSFHFQILTLWTEDAREYLEKRIISMYPLLPTMDHADAHLLLKAIDGMIEYYQENETELAERLLWFRIFLERTDTVSLKDKREVEERLNTFEQLLEESSFARQLRERSEARGRAEGEARGRAEGEARGKAEGEVQAMRAILVDVVKSRFPSLRGLAQECVNQTDQAATLRDLIHMIVAAPDEATARAWLSSPSTTS